MSNKEKTECYICKKEITEGRFEKTSALSLLHMCDDCYSKKHAWDGIEIDILAEYRALIIPDRLFDEFKSQIENLNEATFVAMSKNGKKGRSTFQDAYDLILRIQHLLEGAG